MKKYKKIQNVNYLSQNEQFLTFDLGLASSLVTLGFELWELDKDNPKKVQFIFKRDKGIDKAVNDYWGDKMKLNARTLFDNQKMLKNRLYSN